MTIRSLILCYAEEERSQLTIRNNKQQEEEEEIQVDSIHWILFVMCMYFFFCSLNYKDWFVYINHPGNVWYSL